MFAVREEDKRRKVSKVAREGKRKKRQGIEGAERGRKGGTKKHKNDSHTFFGGATVGGGIEVIGIGGTTGVVLGATAGGEAVGTEGEGMKAGTGRLKAGGTKGTAAATEVPLLRATWGEGIGVVEGVVEGVV